MAYFDSTEDKTRPIDGTLTPATHLVIDFCVAPGCKNIPHKEGKHL